MDSKVPPLPDLPERRFGAGYSPREVAILLTAYGAECRRLALEQALDLCRQVRDAGRIHGAKDCATAIRALSSQGQQQEGGT